MNTKHGVYDVATFKALSEDGEERGKFEALVSVFGNIDLQGDRVVKGAFTNTLDEWKATGAPIPIIWSHDWGNPNAHIGSAMPDEVVETDDGLKVGGSIDLDNPFAAQVYRLLKERRVKEFSFGYTVRKEKKAEDEANDLLELGLIEVGPTLKGANPSTELLAVKSELEGAALWTASVRESAGDPNWADSMPSSGWKAGRSISTKNEVELRTAYEALGRVLESLGKTDDEAKPESEEKREADVRLLDLRARILKEGA